MVGSSATVVSGAIVNDAIELQLSTGVNPYLDMVVAKFEDLYRARREALAEGEE